MSCELERKESREGQFGEISIGLGRGYDTYDLEVTSLVWCLRLISERRERELGERREKEEGWIELTGPGKLPSRW